MLPRIGLALGIGTAGGCAFHLVPLPSMLGALLATMLTAIAKAPLRAPARMRPAVIGVPLGSRFAPEILAPPLDCTGTRAVLMGHWR